MIKIEGITKTFGTLEVLKGIDLEINKGEIVSIVGPSGAGKTTLLHIMGTLDRPDSGRVMYDGRDVMTMNDARLSAFRNANVGFIFQFHQLLPEFTALENVMIPAFIAGRTVSQASARAGELLKFMGLSQRAGHKPSQLSGGEQQRVAVARALMNNPSVANRWDRPSSSSPTTKPSHRSPTAPYTCVTASSWSESPVTVPPFTRDHAETHVCVPITRPHPSLADAAQHRVLTPAGR